MLLVKYERHLAVTSPITRERRRGGGRGTLFDRRLCAGVIVWARKHTANFRVKASLIVQRFRSAAAANFSIPEEKKKIAKRRFSRINKNATNAAINAGERVRIIKVRAHVLHIKTSLLSNSSQPMRSLLLSRESFLYRAAQAKNSRDAKRANIDLKHNFTGGVYIN